MPKMAAATSDSPLRASDSALHAEKQGGRPSLNSVAKQGRARRLVCFLTLIPLLLATISPVHAQKKGLDFGSLGLPEIPEAAETASDQPIAYAAQYTLEASGAAGQLQVTATVEPDWHTYSTTQPPGGPKPTRIMVASSKIELTGPFTSDAAPHVNSSDLYPGVPIEEHDLRVTWSAPFKVITKDPAVPLGELELAIDALVCSASNCLPVSTKVPAKRVAASTAIAIPIPAYRAKDSHTEVSVTLEPAEVQPGGTANLVVSFRPDAGYHINEYEAGSSETSFRTLMVPAQKSGLEFGTPTTTAPLKTQNAAGLVIKYHEGPVSWRIPVRVPKTAAVGAHTLELLVGYNTCNESSCDPPTGIKATGTLMIGDTPGRARPSPLAIEAIAFRDVAGHPDLASWIDFRSEPSGSNTETATSSAENSPQLATNVGSLNLWTICAALLGGFILNFMPCVLPVIGLKVMGFVEQAGSSRGEVIKLNLAYVLGILAVMWTLAFVTIATKNAFSWGQQFTLFEFKLAMAGLVFAMALSFLGVWEIPIPGFATSYQSNKLMEREGITGAFAKGLLTTILATPCSGPFLGFVFAVTLTQPPLGVFIIYTLVGLGMGLPFLVLCVYPQMIKRLPKPGAWMETLKELLAFPLLLTVVYFVASIPSDLRIATLSTLMAVWFGCWLVGKVPAYADLSSKIKAWSAAVAAIVLCGLLSFNLLGPSKSGIPWQPFSPERLAALRRSGSTVMVDFTANWCLNCQFNTHTAIEKPKVAEWLEKNQVVPLLADWTEPSEVIERQIKELGSKTIPLLAIYPADGTSPPIILRDVITEKQLLEALAKAGPSKASSKLSGSSPTRAPKEPPPKVPSKLASTAENAAQPTH